MNDLLWFFQEAGSLCPGEAWLERQEQRQLGSLGKLGQTTKLAQFSETFEISPFKLGLSQVIQLQASSYSDQNPGDILEICPFQSCTPTSKVPLSPVGSIVKTKPESNRSLESHCHVLVSATCVSSPADCYRNFLTPPSFQVL